MIKYQRMKWDRETYRTIKYGNLLADSVQGMVDKSNDGTWCGWFDNSNNSRSAFRLGFKSRAAAAAWVNSKLREAGVK